MSIQYHYNVTGNKRKDFVQAVSRTLEKPAFYQKAPTFAYQIDSYCVDREGTLSCPEAKREECKHLVSKLREAGYIPQNQANADENHSLVIEMPRKGFDSTALANLEKIVESKQTLFKKAFETDNVELLITEDTISFPWFTLHDLEGEAEAYNLLVTALCKMAREQKRVTAKERDIQNDKFMMRLFLVRLGFVGDKYKNARKILLKNLSGNGSWKAGHRPE